MSGWGSRIAGVMSLVVPLSPVVGAQWPSYPTPGVPRTPDGKPVLDGPAPRTPDGKVDFSGIWSRIPLSTFREVAGRGFQLPLRPWAVELRKKRMAHNNTGSRIHGPHRQVRRRARARFLRDG